MSISLQARDWAWPSSRPTQNLAWGDQMQIVDFRPEQSLNLLNHKEWTKTTLSLTPETNQEFLDGYSVPYFSWFLGLVVCILYYCFILPPKMSFSKFFIGQGCHMISQQFLYIMSAKVKENSSKKSEATRSRTPSWCSDP